MLISHVHNIMMVLPNLSHTHKILIAAAKHIELISIVFLFPFKSNWSSVHHYKCISYPNIRGAVTPWVAYFMGESRSIGLFSKVYGKT